MALTVIQLTGQDFQIILFIYLNNFHIRGSGSVSADQNANDVSKGRIQNRPNMHHI